MKTSLYILTLFTAFNLVSCDSATEPAVQKRAAKGSTFTFSQVDFDADGNQVDSTTTVYTIDSANMTIDAQTDILRAVSPADTILFNYDATAMHVYRPAFGLFEGITLPALWQNIEVTTDTSIITLGTYSGQTTLNGMLADVTISDREQYLGTSTLVVTGKSFEAIRKSFTVEVQVYIEQFDVTVTTSVTVVYAYVPELGFIAATSNVRVSDSQFSPIPPGRSELSLTSYTLE